MADFDFVNTDSAKIYTTVIGALMEHCNEALYPGDERRIFGEALVQVFVSLFSEFNDKMKQKALQYARGNVLDAIGDRYRVERIAPAAASATFRFYVSAAQDTNIMIPAGTRITSDGSVYFATEETAVIPAGGTQIDLIGVCINGGATYNGFIPGSVATLVDLIPYVSNVANITATAGGDDGEPYTTEGDDRYRERIRLAPSILSTAGPESAYRFFALSADPGIVDVAIVCPEDAPNTVNLYPLMSGGVLPDVETLEKVLAACSADDVRPMTDHVVALAPTVVPYEIEIKYYCAQEDEEDTIRAIEGAGGSIEKYNEWQTAALGRTINPDQLRRFLLVPPNGPGALRVDVVKPALTTLTKSQVAQLTGTPVITHEVVIV